MATLRQLKTFVAVAEYKRMSEAARHLYISQPTVSQIISDLENEYKVSLFERLPKELKITHAGKILLNSALEIIAINEHLDQAMHNLTAKRQLRVGATLTVGNTLMSTIIEELNNKYPDIDASVLVDNTRTIEHSLLSNELDIALVEGIITRKEIFTNPIIEDHLKIICGTNHPFASKESISIEDLKNQDFIMREKGSGTRAIFENIMSSNHIPFTIKWECTSETSIIDAVRHNLGLAVLSERCCKRHLERKEFHICSISGISMKRYFYVCYNQKHPVSSQMLDFIPVAKSMQECSC